MTTTTHREQFEANEHFQRIFGELETWLKDRAAAERMNTQKERHAEYRALAESPERLTAGPALAQAVNALMLDIEDIGHLTRGLMFDMAQTIARLRDVCGKGMCVWCDWKYETDVGALPESVSADELADAAEQERIAKERYDAVTEAVKAHVRECANHPMRALESAIGEACEIIEIGDQRLLAGDGPVGGLPPDISLAEWKRMYRVLKGAA